MIREEEIFNQCCQMETNVPDRKVGFIEGAKWADLHPNLSEEEQVGMGELEMMWQKEALIKKACEWLKAQEEMIGISFEEDFIERFKEAMEE